MSDNKNSVYHQEKERRANDLLRVYNPTDSDYVTRWDIANGAKVFRVPAKQEAVLVRYIAEKYMKEMYAKIVQDNAQQAVIAENQTRVTKGMAEMTAWREQERFESKFYLLSKDETAKILATLHVGVESEFGLDSLPQAEVPQAHDGVKFDEALEMVQSGAYTSEKSPNTSQEKKFACKYPGCTFASNAAIALQGHTRTHRDDGLEAKKQQAIAGVSQ